MWSWFIFTLVYRFMLLFKYNDKNHPRILFIFAIAIICLIIDFHNDPNKN
ncbi:hypothetical protein HMPREF1654_01207 [Streptococcus intermedius SK54 = ATCC 27335]|nr:hypothetical protein HMPREF1654_01207 [Streptococcus intermedius SK54 = ATCC 27335]SQH52017.1 Uncharacterised protein [Streptococcus intermedius]